MLSLLLIEVPELLLLACRGLACAYTVDVDDDSFVGFDYYVVDWALGEQDYCYYGALLPLVISLSADRLI